MTAEEDNDEVFATSSAPADSCTLGVWAAFEPRNQVLVLDTEGMLGIGGNDGQTNENRRTRQLLKVLAISDVVICKTRYVQS
jgi:zinc finger FYVE domain-containing protein 1